MATTAVCEQLAIELEEMGPSAAHVSPHSLHPTVAATNFLNRRTAEGAIGLTGKDAKPLDDFGRMGVTTAAQLIDGLFDGLQNGDAYIIVDHPADVPTTDQIALRMADQVTQRRPRRAEQLAGVMLMAQDHEGFAARVKRLGIELPQKTMASKL